MLRFAFESHPLVLHGNIVGEDGACAMFYVLVENGKITYKGKDAPDSVPLGTNTIELAANQLVFPGLLNLHTHIEYNILPLWETKPDWDDRFEWRSSASYHQAIHCPLDYISQHWIPMPGRPDLLVTYQLLSEMQALAGGTTTLQESQFLASEQERRAHLLLRSTGVPEDLGLPESSLIDSVIDFYTPNPRLSGYPRQDTSGSIPEQTDCFAEFIRNLGNIRATLAHLAEGRAGFLPNRSRRDAYTRNEFTSFCRDIRQHDELRSRIQDAHVMLIHACGMDLRESGDLQFMVDYGMGMVWSPVSNLLLYDDTNPIPLLPQAKFPTALGSDWSPSGSKNVWEEAKFALYFIQALRLPVEDPMKRLFAMVTTEAARSVGREGILGRTDVGYLGDFFILEKPSSSSDALEAFFQADDSHVVATIVGGFPVYGEESLVKQFNLPYQRMPDEEQPRGCTKVWCFPDSIHINLNSEIAEIDELLGEMKIQRSRLLSVVDVPYQRRIQELKEHLRDSTDEHGNKERTDAVLTALSSLR